MPAEVSLYLLNFVDRLIILRSLGAAEAGLYSLAVKFAQAVNVLVRGFQLAWPPLAYSIREDGEARRVYATVVTLFAAGCAFVVTGMWLFSRWIVRALAAPDFFDAYEAVGLVSAAVTLYALYMVMVVILGRTGRTEFNLPAAIAALLANVALNLILVPPLGIVGAGLALVGSYLVVVVLMYAFTQRLFPVPYQWGRLLRVVAVSAALVGLAELLVPTSGLDGFLLPRRPPRRLPRRALPQRLLHRRRARLARPPAPPPGARDRAARAGRAARRRGRPPPRGLRGRAHGRGPQSYRVPSSQAYWAARRRGRGSTRRARGGAPGARGRGRRPPAGRG